MPAVNKQLKKAGDSQVAPQHYNAKTDDYEYTQGEDGALFFKLKESLESFTFADAVTAAGSRTYTGVGEKKITVTLLGPGVATFTAKLVSQGSKFEVQGFRETGQFGLVNTGVPGEIITFEKPAGIDLELSWTASTGGAVSAKAVIS